MILLKFVSALALTSLLGPFVCNGLGCMKTVCSNEPRNLLAVNKLIDCPARRGHCGNYRSLRSNNQFVEAVDLECNEGISVHAPFDGEISYYQPFGGTDVEKECADQGARIEGTGQWRGYYALITTVKLDKYGGSVKAGEKIGKVGNLECFTGSDEGRFVRFQLFRQGQPVDPTSHLIDCMCTGQICETNRNNALIGLPFKFDSRYNGVRGWELKCPAIDQSTTNSVEEGDEPRAPRIYSPIDGNVVGRIRLDYSSGTYAGCENEGLFVVGTGKWTDYDVRIYNARFRKDLDLGNRRIEQGQHIGQRLMCTDSPQSVTIEVRFQGSVVDISEAITAANCKHKTFNTLF